MNRLVILVVLCAAACGGSKKPATAPTNAGSGAVPATDNKTEAGKPDGTGNAAPSAEEDPCAVPPQ